MRALSPVLIFLTITLSTFSQTVKNVDTRIFTILSDKGDTIQFLKIDSSLIKKKPTIIFCQGSLPVPLIIDVGVKNFIPTLNNFNYLKLSEKYNFIVISMPHTPIIVAKEQLNKRFQYISSVKQENKFDSLYLLDNYKENYVERANCVLKFLKKQDWVDKKKIFVCGHSQGSYIAIELAKRNSDIKAIGYFGGTPSARFCQNIRQQRRDIIANKISDEIGQKNIDEYYNTWKLYCKGENPEGDNADSAKTWLSFSKPLWTDLIKLKTPIFIAYGTKDLDSCEGCELLPIYFESEGKLNYKMMPFVGCGHNFEEISSAGISNYDKMHWDDVMNNFVNWLEQL